MFTPIYKKNIRLLDSICSVVDACALVCRCMCRLNPPSGSKAVKAKRQSGTSAKVLSLLNNIAEFEWLG